MSAQTCNTCCRDVRTPFRVYDGHGKVTLGCIDACHDGYLYGESARWHNRPEAKRMRKQARDRLRELLA